MENFKDNWKIFKDGLKLKLHTFKFVLGIVKEAEIWTHNIANRYPDYKTKKVVHSLKDVVMFGRDIARPNRYINGKKVEYLKTISAFDFEYNFLFVVWYKNAP